MSAKSVKGEGGKKPASAATNLIAGGGAVSLPTSRLSSQMIMLGLELFQA